MDSNCEIIDLCDIKTVKSEDTSSTIPLDENENPTTTELTEEENVERQKTTKQWVDDTSNLLPNMEEKCMEVATIGNPIPYEVAQLVNKDCAIKLINHLAIYAVNKNTEAKLHATICSITPDFDPQLNYRSKIGFSCIYERCVVLFYEALIDLTEILAQFALPTQKVVILWMYNMVEHLCLAHGVDGRFLRHENFIERILTDFTKSQKETPDNQNIFFEVYRKSLPTPVAQSGVVVPPPAKKPRKPRTKKVKPDQNTPAK